MSELVPKEREINPSFQLEHSVLDPEVIQEILKARGDDALGKSRAFDTILILDFLKRRKLSEEGHIKPEEFELWKRAYEYLLAPLRLEVGPGRAFPRGNEDLRLLEELLKAAHQVETPDIKTLEKAAKFYQEVRSLLEN